MTRVKFRELRSAARDGVCVIAFDDIPDLSSYLAPGLLSRRGRSEWDYVVEDRYAGNAVTAREVCLQLAREQLQSTEAMPLFGKALSDESFVDFLFSEENKQTHFTWDMAAYPPYHSRRDYENAIENYGPASKDNLLKCLDCLAEVSLPGRAALRRSARN